MILFQQVLCLLYITSPGFWPSWLYTIFRSVLSPAADSLFLPRSVPNRDASCRRTRFLAARKQRGPSGAPAVCRIHILFTYRSDPGAQAPSPGILQAQSPLALDHDTDDLFIGLFHSVLGETAHVLDGVLHTLLYDAVAAIELLAFDVHIIA